MTESLPRGLVKTNEAVGQKLEQLDRARDNELHQLWKAYKINKAALPFGEGVRLENLFWRIWSNPGIKKYTNGRRLAMLFRSISRGNGMIMKKPRLKSPSTASTPPHSHSVTNSSPGSSRSSSTVVPDSKRPSPASQFSSVEESTLVSPSQNPRSGISKPLPPPILKKSRASSKDARDLARGDFLRKSVHDLDDGAKTAKPSNCHGDEGIEEENVHNSEKKRPSFDGSTTALPEGVRSHIPAESVKTFNSSGFSRSGKNPSKSSTSDDKSPLQNSSAGHEMSASRLVKGGTTVDLSQNSWQDVDSSEPDEPTPALKPQPNEWLVDKNFRDKFADSRKSSASQTNLPGLSKNLSVRFLDQLHPHSGSRTSAARGSVDLRNVSASSAPIQDVQQDTLPRTRSQLSIMVDRERKIGSLKQVEGYENKTADARKSSRDKQDSSSEEEGIVMGTGVGKTKVTKKGRKSDKKKDATAHYHSQASDSVW